MCRLTTSQSVYISLLPLTCSVGTAPRPAQPWWGETEPIAIRVDAPFSRIHQGQHAPLPRGCRLLIQDVFIPFSVSFAPSLLVPAGRLQRCDPQWLACQRISLAEQNDRLVTATKPARLVSQIGFWRVSSENGSSESLEKVTGFPILSPAGSRYTERPCLGQRHE